MNVNGRILSRLLRLGYLCRCRHQLEGIKSRPGCMRASNSRANSIRRAPRTLKWLGWRIESKPPPPPLIATVLQMGACVSPTLAHTRRSNKSPQRHDVSLLPLNQLAAPGCNVDTCSNLLTARCSVLQKPGEQARGASQESLHHQQSRERSGALVPSQSDYFHQVPGGGSRRAH